MNFSLFFLKKYFWDFYDNFFLVIAMNIIYTVLLFPCYAGLLMSIEMRSPALACGVMGYVALLFPLFHPMLSTLQKMAKEEDVTFLEFYNGFKSITWKRYLILGLMFAVIGSIIGLNGIFYLKITLKNILFVPLPVLLMFVLMLFINTTKCGLFYFLNTPITKQKLLLVPAVVIEFFPFLFPWEIFWISMQFLSLSTAVGVLLFFPATYLLFYAIFLRMVDMNYQLKEKILEEDLSRPEFFRRYKREQLEFYTNYTGKDDRYTRTLKNILKPWD